MWRLHGRSGCLQMGSEHVHGRWVLERMLLLGKIQVATQTSLNVHASSGGKSNNGSCWNNGRFLVQRRRRLNGTLTPHWQHLRMDCWENGMDPARVLSLPLPWILLTHAGGDAPVTLAAGASPPLARGLEGALKRTNCQKGRVTGARWLISGIF